mgnify:CR=1 FL=1
MNKILVKVFFPRIDKCYEVWIPTNQNISNIIALLCNGVNELNGNNFKFNDMIILYNRQTGEYYDYNEIVKETDIRNGTELILI